MYTLAGVDVSGGLGYRLGRGLDAAVAVGWGGPVDDIIFPYAPEVHVGTEIAATLGPGQRWRLAAAAGVTVSGANTFAFPYVDEASDWGPTELRGGSVIAERRARATVTRYAPLRRGRIRVLAGVGLYGSVRRYTSSTLIFGAGGPRENVVGGETETELSAGVVAALPVVLQLSERADLVLEPELRLDVRSFYLSGGGDGQITLRLNL